LDEYVNAEDSSYSYYVLETYDEDPDFTVFVLNMTSQTWLDDSWSDSPTWWHYLSIFIPKAADRITDAGFIHISNGNHNDSTPTMDNGWMIRTGEFCRNTKAVAAILKTVPYQPIKFNGTRYKTEDFIIGYTWRMFIEDPSDDPDPNMIVLLPMVKAAKKAVDTMVEFTNTQDSAFNLEKFMATGFSKRGWTTWLLGCVDPRIFAIAPTVFDLLNMQPNLEHHYRSFGGWSWAFFPYWAEDVSRYLYHPRVEVMAEFIDPISFNERLTMPKLVICAAGDQFFPPDGSYYFWEELTGPKYLQIWENDDHSLTDHLDRRDSTLQGFFLSVYRGVALPGISWLRQENEDSGRISLTVNQEPTSIISWVADTTNVTCEPDPETGICRRDFRIRALNGTTGIWWETEEVYDLGNLQYFVAHNHAEFGYRGFFMQMTYDGPDGLEMTFTTEMSIIPDTLPYEKCETEDECAGRLV
jgi:PhoPQ-activated pathogenicity-related protein